MLQQETVEQPHLVQRVAHTPPKGALIACFKNEGPWVIEWLAHHSALGFGPIGVVTNNCEDKTDQLLKALRQHGYLYHFDQTGLSKRAPQVSGYQHLMGLEQFATADWLMMLDGDEFFNPRNLNVQTFVSRYSFADFVVVSWRIFGANGAMGFPQGAVTETFTRAARVQHRANAAFKTLVRQPYRFTAMNYHMPARFKPEHKAPNAIACVDGETCELDTSDPSKNLRMDLNDAMAIHRPVRNYATAQINHYAVKTPEIFRFKAARGRGAKGEERRHTEAFFRFSDRNEVEDLSVLDHREGRSRETLAMLAHSDVASLHQETCALWADRIAAGRADFSGAL